MSSNEICTAPASGCMQDIIAAAAHSIQTTHTLDADERELQEPSKPARNQVNESKIVYKEKGRDPRKHGVMSLPAEIREK